VQKRSLLDFGTCYQLEFSSDHIKHSNAPLGSRGSFVCSAACGGVGWVFAMLRPLNQVSGDNALLEINI
jgi:hypothetical protein